MVPQDPKTPKIRLSNSREKPKNFWIPAIYERIHINPHRLIKIILL